MEPLVPDRTGELADLAVEIYAVSAHAAGHVHPITLRELGELLRVVNSYYSNLIEGNSTHPIDVMHAMKRRFDADPARRALQEESVAHVEVQRLLERRLAEEPQLEVTASDFLVWLHEQFYRRLPDALRWVDDPQAKRRIEVVPGRLRTEAVGVGLHVGPHWDALPRFLSRFQEVYAPGRLHGHDRLIAAAAAHHRLLWIHPFMDGNGRVARLFTDAYLRRVGVQGYGLWSVSRGLARASARYKEMLAAADSPREGDLDGRGNLSMRRLREWCHWFLSVSLEQAQYMSGLMQLDRLRERLSAYVRLRKDGVAPGPDGYTAALRPESHVILLHTLVAGEMARGAFTGLTGSAERTNRLALKALLEEGLLRSDTAKGPVRLGFPPHALAFFFPDLVPAAGPRS